MANSVDRDQTAPLGAVCSGSTLFASILNSSVMLGNYLQQTTSADDIFRCIFRVKINQFSPICIEWNIPFQCCRYRIIGVTDHLLQVEKFPFSVAEI